MLIGALVLMCAFIITFNACSLSNDEIRSSSWKFNDEYPSICEHCDFLHFDGPGFALRNDTVFSGEVVVAVVVRSFHWAGRPRLQLRKLSTGRVVEYTGI